MIFGVNDATVEKPWLQQAVRAYCRAARNGATVEEATRVFDAMANLGTRREARHRVGSSWKDEIKKENDQVSGELYDALKGLVGGADLKGSSTVKGSGISSGAAAEAALDGAAWFVHEWDLSNKRRGPSDDLRWYTYSFSDESARAYADKYRADADNFGETRAVGWRYHSQQFMDDLNLDGDYLDGLGKLIEANSAYRDDKQLEGQLNNNPAWATGVYAKWGAELTNHLIDEERRHYEDVSAKLGDIDKRVESLETGVKENNRLIKHAVTLIDKVQQNVTKLREEQQKGFSQNNKKLDGLEKILKDRFAQEDERRQAEKELERLHRQQQQIAQEKMEAFDSAAMLFQQFGALNPSLQKPMSKLAEVARLTKRMEQLRNASPISNVGKTALTMDWISLGMQLTTFAMGIGGPSMDEQILKAVINLTEQMHERFDQVEHMLTDLQRRMDKHFDAVHEALDELRADQKLALSKLNDIKKDLEWLTRQVDYYGRSMLEIANSAQWNTLVGHESDYITKRTLDLNSATLAQGLTEFLKHGVDHAVLPSIIGPSNAFTPGMSFEKGLSVFNGLPDVGDKVHAMMMFEEAVFGIPFPDEERRPIPDEKYWTKASTSYLKLVEENLSKHLFSVDMRPGLASLQIEGRRIEKACMAARDIERVDLLIDNLNLLARNSFMELNRVALASMQRAYGGLPTDIRDLKSILPEGPFDDLDGSLRKRIQNKIRSANFDPGNFRLRVGGGKYVPVSGGKHLAHPGFLATAHFARQLRPDVREGYGYVIHVDAEVKHWTARQEEKEKRFSMVPVIGLRVFIPELERADEIEVSLETLRQTMESFPEPKPGVESVSSGLFPRQYVPNWKWKLAQLKRQWTTRMEAHQKQQYEHAATIVKARLVNEWKYLIDEFLEKSPRPWQPGFGTDSEKLHSLMAQLEAGIRGDLHSLILRSSQDTFVFGKEAPRAYPANDKSLWYLDKATGDSILALTADLRAGEEILMRHFLQFAPDFVFSATSRFEQWRSLITWSPRVTMLNVRGMFDYARMGDTTRVNGALENVDWHEKLTKKRGMHTHVGNKLKIKYRAYLESLPPDTHPQCAGIRDTLFRLDQADQAVKTFEQVRETSRILAREIMD